LSWLRRGAFCSAIASHLNPPERPRCGVLGGAFPCGSSHRIEKYRLGRSPRLPGPRHDHEAAYRGRCSVREDRLGVVRGWAFNRAEGNGGCRDECETDGTFLGHKSHSFRVGSLLSITADEAFLRVAHYRETASTGQARHTSECPRTDMEAENRVSGPA